MPPAPTDYRLVLVTGSTRSGTSLAAGTLHHLGLHVPLPVLRANASNPAGFFESKWPVTFHKRLMARAGIGSVDARPEVFQLMMDAVRPEERDELRDWLRGVFDAAPRVAVKDPRASWVTDLWGDAVSAAGGRIGHLLMVRHPAEVIASRTTYYASDLDAERAWYYRVRNLGAWINLTTGLERDTRHRPRVVARYEDLLADWRAVARRIGTTLGIELDLGTEGEHPIDGFVDPGLHRHAASWGDAAPPAALVELAEGVWAAMSDLARDESAGEAQARLGALRASFVEEMRVASALTHDVTAGAVAAVRRQLALGSDPPQHASPMPTSGTARRLGRRFVPARIRRLAPRPRG